MGTQLLSPMLHYRARHVEKVFDHVTIMLRTGWRRIVQLPIPYRLINSRRAFQTENLASDAFTKEDGRVARMEKALRFVRALEPVDRQAVSSMLRVDHAGEVAANTIYEAQADVFGCLAQVPVKNLILDMWENEKKHLQAASTMLDDYRTRPSGLLPLWALAGRLLGGITACLGEKSAMACTEAVETAIGEHYDEYVRELTLVNYSISPKYNRSLHKSILVKHCRTWKNLLLCFAAC